MTPEAMSKAFEKIMGGVYYSLGMAGEPTKGRAVLIDLPYRGSQFNPVDARLKELEGVWLVGSGRSPTETLKTAMGCE